MAGFFDGLQQSMMSPLFLGGAALMGGEGIGGAIRGAGAGMGFQDHQRQLAEQQAQKEQYNSLLGKIGGSLPPDMMALAQMQGPKAAPTIWDYLDKQRDPMRGLDAKYKTAQINKMNREAADAGTAFGKNGSIFLNPETGRYEAVQFGGDGTIKRTPLDGLTPSRGVETVGDTIVDKATGNVLRNVGDAISGAEQAKISGRSRGEIAANAPKAAATMRDLEQQWSTVDKSIDDAINSIGVTTSGTGGTALSYVPGTGAYDLSNTLDTIKANIGFDKLQSMRDNSPTGGALGQVSEFENRLLQSVRGSLQQGQSPAQLKRNLEQVKLDLRALQEDRRRAFAETYGAPTAPANAPDSDWRNSFRRVD